HSNLSLARFVAVPPGAMPTAAVITDTPSPPNDALPGTAHYNLGLAFRQKGYWREAMKEYRLALDRGEHRAPVIEAMAEVHLLQHESAAAIALYDTLLEDAPTRAKYWN